MNEPDRKTGSYEVTEGIQGVELGTLDTHFLVRAARRRGDAPRIYTAVYEATDQAGNVTRASVEIYVPANRGHGGGPAGTAN
jgi:hypothetical protein